MVLAFVSSLAAADVLDCKFDELYNAYQAPMYGCNVNNNFIGPNVTSVTGQHAAGKSNADVLALLMEYRNGKFFPRHAQLFFPNIESIEIVGSGIEVVSSVDLAFYPKLTHLFMNYNLISVLSPNTFAANPGLKQISFYDNPITSVAPGIFDNLGQLTLLDMFHLPCVNRTETTRSGVLSMIPTLEQMCPWTDLIEPCKQRVVTFEDKLPAIELSADSVVKLFDQNAAKSAEIATRMEQFITVLNLMVDKVNTL